MSFRIGQGFDVHAFEREPGRPLLLAGVHVADAPGLAGHSDADVVMHAVADAVLGATGGGDLGSRFGTGDPRFADAGSEVFVRSALDDARKQGWAPVNVDCTIIAQHPRLAPFRVAMARSLAAVVGTEASVKITSADRLGSIGRGEGIACLAVVLLGRE